MEMGQWLSRWMGYNRITIKLIHNWLEIDITLKNDKIHKEFI